MEKSKYSGMGEAQTISTDRLMEILGCGRKTATDLGNAAGARVQVGRRVLWNIEKVRQYIDMVSGS